MFRSFLQKAKVFKVIRWMSSIPKEQIHIKRIEADDYHRVLAIRPEGDVYHGMDYLPNYFHKLLSMPNVEMYAAVVNNELVGFEYISLVDDGKTIVTRGGRVSKKFEGRGISNAMMEWVEKDGPLHKTDVDRHAVTRLTGKSEVLQERKENADFYEVFTRDVRYFKTCRSELIEKLRELQITSYTDVVNENTLSNVLSTQALCQKLFRKRRILADIVPYHPLPTNAKLILNGNTKCVASDLDNPRRALLTFGSSFTTPTALVLNFEVYGHVGRNVTEHILTHLERTLPNLKSESIVVQCFTSPLVNSETFDELMQKAGIEKTLGYASKMICFERNL